MNYVANNINQGIGMYSVNNVDYPGIRNPEYMMLNEGVFECIKY